MSFLLRLPWAYRWSSRGARLDSRCLFVTSKHDTTLEHRLGNIASM